MIKWIEDGFLTKDDEVLLAWVGLELILGVSKIVDSIGKISSSRNGGDVSQAPKVSKESESTRLLCWCNIGVSATKLALKLGAAEGSNAGA